MVPPVKPKKIPFPVIPQDSFYQKALSAIPFLGEPLSLLSQASLNSQMAKTKNPLQQREIKRIQKDYIIVDAFRYLFYGFLFLRWIYQKP